MDNKRRGSGEGPGFAVVEHMADWAIWVRGEDLAELLLNAARGMSSLLVADVAQVAVVETRRVAVEGFDRESVLVEWLSELAYLAERDGFIGREFQWEKVSTEELVAVVRGGPAPELEKHIKAVTYHKLAVVETEAGLETTVVFDV